jgi:hypothetical protein
MHRPRSRSASLRRNLSSVKCGGGPACDCDGPMHDVWCLGRFARGTSAGRSAGQAALPSDAHPPHHIWCALQPNLPRSRRRMSPSCAQPLETSTCAATHPGNSDADDFRAPGWWQLGQAGLLSLQRQSASPAVLAKHLGLIGGFSSATPAAAPRTGDATSGPTAPPPEAG